LLGFSWIVINLLLYKVFIGNGRMGKAKITQQNPEGTEK
jgi:hypothetical protein